MNFEHLTSPGEGLDLIARITVALHAAYSDIVTEAYQTGFINSRKGEYDTCRLSDAEWLVSACGFGNAQLVPLPQLKAALEVLPDRMVEAVYQGKSPFEVTL